MKKFWEIPEKALRKSRDCHEKNIPILFDPGQGLPMFNKEELNECFFSQNKGLRRRFPWIFTIESFTKEELAQIFVNKVNDTEEYELHDEVDNKFLESKIKKEYFNGNAGDIENIISRAKIINSRVNFCKEENYILTKEIINEAFDKFYDTRITNVSKVPFMMYT